MKNRGHQSAQGFSCNQRASECAPCSRFFNMSIRRVLQVELIWSPIWIFGYHYLLITIHWLAELLNSNHSAFALWFRVLYCTLPTWRISQVISFYTGQSSSKEFILTLVLPFQRHLSDLVLLFQCHLEVYSDFIQRLYSLLIKFNPDIYFNHTFI